MESLQPRRLDVHQQQHTETSCPSCCREAPSAAFPSGGASSDPSSSAASNLVRFSPSLIRTDRLEGSAGCDKEADLVKEV